MEDPLSIYGTIISGLSIIFLLFLSAVFSGSETAFTAMGKHKLKEYMDNNENLKKRPHLEKFLNNPNQYLTTILIMNNVVNILASSLTTIFVSNFFPGAGKTVAIATGFLTLMILIFGEITPKVYARKNQEKYFKFTFSLINFLRFILTPLVWLLVHLSNIIIKVFGGESIDANVPFFTENDLMSYLDVGHEEGALEKYEKFLMQRSLEIRETSVREIMTPRVEISAIESTDSIYNVIKIINDEGYSRIPVYENSIDNIVGVFYAKDFFKLLNDKFGYDEIKNLQIKELMHKPYFVPLTMKAKDILKMFLTKHIHMAIVVDEYGGTSGLVTLEDVIEELTGEIMDEYDDIIEEANITKLEENSLLVNGATPINDIEREFDCDFPSTDFETISGFLLEKLERFPKPGEKLVFDDFEFEVISITVNRIDKVKVTKSINFGNNEGDNNNE